MAKSNSRGLGSLAQHDEANDENRSDDVWPGGGAVGALYAGATVVDAVFTSQTPSTPASSPAETAHVQPSGSSVATVAAAQPVTAPVSAVGDTPVTLFLGGVAHGELSAAAPTDRFSVSLVAGTTYTFAMTGIGVDNVQDPHLRLIGTDGETQLTENDDGLQGQNSIFTFVATTTGEHFLDVSSHDSSATAREYGVSFTAGTKASFDVAMGAGVIDTDQSWSATAGTGATVTYGFRQSAPTYTLNITIDGVTTDRATTWSALTAEEITAFEAILQTYSELTGLVFERVEPVGNVVDATLIFTNYTFDDNSGGFAAYPGSTASAALEGDVWLNTGQVTINSLPVGSYSYYTLMHEVGHALGLSHPGVYNATPGVAITYAADAQFTQDSHQYTIMSYFDETSTLASQFDYPDTPMVHDVQAIQNIYGANTATRAGNTVYGFNSTAGSLYDFALNADPAFTIWDGGGNDTLDCSGFATVALVNLQGGLLSSVGGLGGNLSIAAGAVIENAIGGSNNDAIAGNAAANTLTGNGGNDTLSGNSGNDTLDGGADTNTINGGEGDDFVNGIGGTNVADGGNGSDTMDYRFPAGDVVWNMTTGVTNVGDTALNFERALMGGGNDSVTGGGAHNVLEGGDGNDTLNGGSGNDTLDGAGGTNTINGGEGNDFVNGIGGTNVADGGNGSDTMDYRFPSGDVVWNMATGVTNVGDTALNFERALMGGGNDSVTGGGADDALEGGDGNDTLNGGSGNDTLGGGTGVDTLNGGAGNDSLDGGTSADRMVGDIGDDIYVANGSGDLTVEGANEGTDLVQFTSNSGFTLQANVENLTLLGTGNSTGTGNTLGNAINGNSGNNLIGGSGGNDILDGGSGNDILDGGSGTDTLNGGDGNDQISDSGTGNDNLDGGAGNDTLDGGTANDTMIGGLGDDQLAGGSLGNDNLNGGSGNDILDGGTGNDILDGSSGTDTLNGGDGNDQISDSGTGNDSLDGGAGNDTLDGGTANDTMIGGEGDDQLAGGSLGNDNLNGGGGNDILGGGSGNDILDGGSGTDTLNGGDGNDQLSDSGTGNDNLDGGAGNDTLDGGTANDTMIGGLGDDRLAGGSLGNDNLNGGDGNDSLDGGTGNDVLDGSFGTDTLNGGAGNDQLSDSGTGHDRLNGEDGNDTLSGGNGDDTLNGGLGNDILTGAIGADRYLFNTTLGSNNVDQITDFDPAVSGEVLQLDDLVFTGLALGVLAASAFRTGAAATDSNDRIIYNSATGAVLFDADGTGATVAVRFATLGASLAITASDFVVL